MDWALWCPVDPSGFRTRHSVPAQVPIWGPYPGVLQHGGETLQLLRPDNPDVTTNGQIYLPYVVVESVRYNDKAPWPTNAAGLGSSLERIDPTAYANDPAAWRASFSSPSPGFENNGNRVPIIQAGPDMALEATTFPVVTNLVGIASDDGQPNPPGKLQVTWKQSSGPASVFFGDPHQLQTSVAFPGAGTYVLQLTASDGELEATDALTVMVERPPIAATLLARGSVWKYLDDGSDQGALWRRPEFDDSAWRSGPAELGYGDSAEGRPEQTTIGFGPDSGNKFITYYFRTTFKVTNASAIRQLTAHLMRDDGAIVYLNGIEAFRSNMPGGDVSSTTLASATVGGADEATYYDSNLDPSLLRSGTNTVAVEVHQVNGTSSDISFDLELDALIAPENQPPTVNAGGVIAANTGTPAALQGSVLDDGLPGAPARMTMTWSKISGPGDVAFGNSGSAVTTATFSAAGTYVLRLSASDGALTAQDDLTVTVTSNSLAEWKAQYFTPAELADANVSGDNADPDHDGHTNQQEFIAGTDPRDAESVLKIKAVEWSGAFRGTALAAVRGHAEQELYRAMPGFPGGRLDQAGRCRCRPKCAHGDGPGSITQPLRVAVVSGGHSAGALALVRR